MVDVKDNVIYSSPTENIEDIPVGATFKSFNDYTKNFIKIKDIKYTEKHNLCFGVSLASGVIYEFHKKEKVLLVSAEVIISPYSK